MVRRWTLAFTVIAAAVAPACTNNSTAPDPTPSRISATPGSLSFTQLGSTAGLRASFQGTSAPPPDSFWHFTSTNPAVATVSNELSPSRTVTAVANGTTTIHITVDTVTDTADIPVTVTAVAPALNAYNGTFKGDANLRTTPIVGLVRPQATCAGSLNSYGETLVINVNTSGAGTATMQDTPGFDRAYQVTIPGSLSFSGTGSFPFFGVPIPGQLQVTLNSLTQLTFQETTTYGSCANTYGGTLTRQP